MMIVAVLVVTALSLGIILLCSNLARGWVNGTLDLLASTRRELRPALLRVRTDAERSAELRAALMADGVDRSR